MLSLAIAIVLALAISIVIQLLMCRSYTRALQAGRTTAEVKRAVEQQPPRICVLMPLRGADPFLRDAIRSVVDNAYPNLTLQIVVDSEQDSALAVVQAALHDVPENRYRIDFLRDHSCDRSLIVSSLMQGVEARKNDCDLFAFCAADMIVPRDFYWHLADAMSDETVGCTLGNRWYQPDEGRWGSLVRQAWNAGAAIIMWLFRIPWGGAATLRPADIYSSGLHADWQTSLVEDVTIHDAMVRHGKSLKFVPALTVINREEIDLPNAARFIQRQMLWARLYHPRWPFVFAHAMLIGSTVLVPLTVAGVAAWKLQFAAAGLAIGGMVAYLAALVLVWIRLEDVVARTFPVSDEQHVPQRTWGRLLRMFLAAPLVQILYPCAVLGCSLARHVDWRGIRYQFLGKRKVRMVEYVPFQPTEQSADGKTSI